MKSTIGKVNCTFNWEKVCLLSIGLFIVGFLANPAFALLETQPDFSFENYDYSTSQQEECAVEQNQEDCDCERVFTFYVTLVLKSQKAKDLVDIGAFNLLVSQYQPFLLHSPPLSCDHPIDSLEQDMEDYFRGLTQVRLLLWSLSTYKLEEGVDYEFTFELKEIHDIIQCCLDAFGF